MVGRGTGRESGDVVSRVDAEVAEALRGEGVGRGGAGLHTEDVKEAKGVEG